MPSKQNEPIAIVGTACRFPGGASTPSALWKLLESPRDVSVDIGPDRFDAKSFFHPDGSHHGTSNVLRSYLLEEDVRLFDAPFFNLSPNEADSMDPQQRILLEAVYEALESGGHTIETLKGSDTSVFVGTMTADYNDTSIRDHNTMPKYYATGTSRAIISNRVSYFFDWHGTSQTIDTACSSSLVALHQGVQTLRSGESRVAVACGTQMLLGPEMYIGESTLKMLSPNGRSAMWDANADGYARGEGVAAVVVKLLSDAIADGDHIECIVRETGTNQDGFSNGITVPSSEAQAALIRQTYSRAGLDPENEPQDRPQVFEAHGTGTQAGDPKEAAAIHSCFGQHIDGADTPLYVGSVKTVIGHLEGCAGLAGVLKGAAMIQAGMVPPNLHFRDLNPKIEPFYNGLQVPTQLTPWPQLQKGVPRRVSVNSFGFGGTNAHAIIEQYEPSTPQPAQSSPAHDASRSLVPFVFSAASEASLVAQLQAYSSHLKSHNDSIKAADLAWTLHSRRSRLSTKAAFPATSTAQLASNIDAALEALSQKPGATIGLRSSNTTSPRMLGVFTGQGAQWAAMGAQLIGSSSFVQERLFYLEESLATLPTDDRPTWCLRDEIMAGEGASRLAEAALSQPLCTAIQVILVDLLRAAGITFAAVVGHSSGEIAAAYAAGFVSARDAIRIAYYRGLYAYLAGNESTGQKGAMLAAGMSWEDAQQLVNSPDFKGRLAVAAHNSPASVTLSGDSDAIEQAKKHLDGEKKFARMLKVDTAYHSHHMLPCGDRYVQALRDCGVRVNRERTDSSCTWFSSVTASAEGVKPTDALQDEYWRDNMTNAVLFADAVKNAIANTEQLDLAIEVGPHPALKGPATQNVAEVQTSPLPYYGVLSRGRDDVEAFSETLGSIWARLPHLVNFESLEHVASDESQRPNLMVGLPSYQWNHARAYWAESRISKRIRTRKHAHHEILGFLSPDSNSHDMRWLNVLKQKEIPWLDGHQLQGQTVFPAAGYVAMALESSKTLAADSQIELIELHRLNIPRAITFEEGDDSGVETLVTLTGIERHPDQTATANFACYSVPVISAGSEHDMELSASGAVKIVFGPPDVATLPCVPIKDYNMTTTDAEHFYKTISELGYNYSGSFRTLSSAKRKLNHVACSVDTYTYDETSVSQYLVHPSMLDVAFQASILAYSAPADGQLWSLSVPTSVGTIRVNPEVCAALPTSGAKVPVCATIDGESKVFSANIDIFSEDSEHGMVQVEDLIMRPFAPATMADDRVMFTNTILGLAQPDGAAAMDNTRPSAYEVELATACERVAYFYLRKWNSEISDDEWATGDSHWVHLRDWISQTLTTASRGQHPTLKNEWSEDTLENIQALSSQLPGSVDAKLLAAIDQILPSAVRGNAVLEQTLPDSILNSWYESGLGFETSNLMIAGMMKQVAHRYPHARVLEIGARGGAATKSNLRAVSNMCSSYTFTNRSKEIIEKASQELKTYNDKMTFNALDVNQPPTEQGFKPHSYDIIVASHVLAGTPSLKTTLENIRMLLKPGGYLILAEITNINSVRAQIILRSLPERLLGVNDGQKSSPLLAPAAWHYTLRKAGFGGVDTRTPEIENSAWPMSIIASQAVNEQVQFLRRPLSSPSPSTSTPFYLESLVILGNGSLETAHIGEAVSEQLERFCGEITILDSLPTEDESLTLNPMSTFLNLVDLDSPIFRDMTDEKMDGLKRMLELAKNVVWVTHGGHLDQPYQMASIAFGRSIRQEAAHINFSHMDFSDLQHNPAQSIAEYLVQQCALDDWEAPPSSLADAHHRDFEFLWSREPEVYVDGGKLKVPRLVSNTRQNARLNAPRRAISDSFPISESNVSIVSSSENLRYSIVEEIYRENKRSPEGVFRVQRSSLKALNIATDTFLFLGIGRSSDNKSHVLLSASNSSETAPVAAVEVPADALSDTNADGLLVAVASELLAEALLQQVLPNSHILVHCSGKDRFFSAAVSRRAVKHAVRVTFTCDDRDEQLDASWVQLNPREPSINMRKALRLINPTHFLDLTAGAELSTLGHRIAEALPSSCTSISTFTLVQKDSSSLPLSRNEKLLTDRLQNIISSSSLPSSEVQDLVVPLSSVRSLNHEPPTTIIHWLSDDHIEIDVRPLDSRSLFSKDKTYLLVGLSGQIGQSLCEWMVSNGAGCVCLTSRRPKVDENWLESFRGTGASVKVVPMDVLNPNSIERVVNELKVSCPPIAGVANGAVIFDDQLFANMSGDTMRRVLAPKIDGSKNLDDVFHNVDLDFFILFSSVVCIYGNAGQSNYSAANGFLNSLVKQRRGRGLAASALDLGMVAGIGYAEAAGQAVQDQLVKKVGLPPVSETDLRQMFAETIVSGIRAEEDPVVTAGLRTINDDEDLRGPWFINPYFSHMIIESKSISGSDGQDKQAALPVSQQLALAANKEEAFTVLQECFATRLRAILQLGDQKIEHDAPLLELGIDSLVAVEVRSWFLKELKVDIPVLRVVSGASLSELCEKALEKLPEKVLVAPEKPQAAVQPATAPATEPQPRPRKTVETQRPSSVAHSESSSTSDSKSTSTAERYSTPTPATTMTTPSAAISIFDPTEAEATKGTKSDRQPRKFLKTERISLPQSRFWYLRHLLEDPTTPNVVIAYRIAGNLRIGDLERAIRIVTNRHEALRTCFVEDENNAGEAYQNVLPSSILRLERQRIEHEGEVETEYTKFRDHVFDLEHGDVMRLLLLTQSSSSHYLLINYHHIVMDGASFNVFFSDLEKAYVGQSLGPAPRQYPEFSAAQRRAIDNGDMQEELKYWKTIFPPGKQAPVLPLLPMARGNSRVPMKGFDTHQVSRHLEPALVAKVKALAKEQRSTPFHLHLAAFKALLFCFAGEDTKDLTIGFADAARNDGSVEKSIGFFLNLLTLQFRRQPEQTFADAIVEARGVAHGALESSRLPFDVLLSELNIARSSTHAPFFQAFLDYRQGVQERHPWGNCQAELLTVNPGRTAYDITLDVTDSNIDSLIVFRVQTSLYDLNAANFLLDTYVQFLETVTGNSSLPLDNTPLFNETQLSQAAQVGRGRNLISDWPATLPHRIDQVAQKQPDSVALMDGTGKVLTYSEMINRIEAISESLESFGVGTGSRVLVYQQPTADWTCSMLAIMRIGAIYVPLNLREPVTRLSAVAKDCKPTAILADAASLEEAQQLLQVSDSQVINVSDLPSAASNHIELRAQLESPAAILYTSGSTGTPKGITVTHAGLRNEIEGYTKTWGLGPERVLQQSAFTFNHSSDQMYTGLVNGGMVYIVPAEKRGDPIEITKIIQEHSITYTKATPSEYSMWIQFGGDNLRQAFSWRFAFGGGEALTTIVTEEFASLKLPQLRFFNSYGPTEISISSHKMEIPYREKEKLENMGRIPCGYSLPNYYTYVVDEQLRPVPVGMPGEICLGGAGVSLGYLNNPDLTSKHFVSNPFATPEDIARGWTRMYRTGDIGHLQEDGAMVFHSRMAGDSQVKIRGLRIELSDIESNILSTAGGALREVVVTLREGDFMVAHVVFAQQSTISDKEGFLQNLLGRLSLPQYMIPAVAITLDKFPLNNHSKVDRKAVRQLPLPERVGGSKEAVEMTETMIQLDRVWRAVLGPNMDKLNIDLDPSTNFFMVGGNSLLVIRLQARIREAFHVVVPLFKLMNASTLGNMSRTIEESTTVDLIDWEKETTPPSIPRFLNNIPAKSETMAKTVLITGATGFLGKYMVRQLAARHDIKAIHCVAVRDKPREVSLFTAPNISYHVGDLSQPLLGLGVDEFRNLATDIDVILHMGAVRSFWDNYHVLRSSNVESIKELVKLAAPLRVPIHYISTVGVLPRDEDVTAENAGSAATNVPSGEGGDGYVASKWAGERILERSMETLGVPARVYRFLPSVVQQSKQKQELMDSFVGFVDKLGLKPDMGVWKGRVDMIPAEDAASWLSEAVATGTSPTSDASAAKFSHYESPVAFHTDELSEYIEQRRGERSDLKTMPLLQWLGRCKAHGFSYLIASQQAMVSDGEGGQALESRR